MQQTWLILLERRLKGVLVDEESMFIKAATTKGAYYKCMEYFIEEGWEIMQIQSA